MRPCEHWLRGCSGPVATKATGSRRPHGPQSRTHHCLVLDLSFAELAFDPATPERGTLGRSPQGAARLITSVLFVQRNPPSRVSVSLGGEGPDGCACPRHASVLQATPRTGGGAGRGTVATPPLSESWGHLVLPGLRESGSEKPLTLGYVCAALPSSLVRARPRDAQVFLAVPTAEVGAAGVQGLEAGGGCGSHPPVHGTAFLPTTRLLHPQMSAMPRAALGETLIFRKEGQHLLCSIRSPARGPRSKFPTCEQVFAAGGALG